jgi:hypothetical protein
LSYIQLIGWMKSGSIAVSAPAITRPPSLAALPTGSPLAGARTRLAHIHLLAKEVFPIQVLDRCLGLSLVKHFDKTESPRLATIFIFNDPCRTYLPKGSKSLSKIFL